ncbi:MAG: hypothetical protein ACJA0H_001145 [Francisellaceae bacterium]|jgi:hypothetical protein
MKREIEIMKNKIFYLFANIVLITGYLLILFFVLLGIDVIFELETFRGFMFMIVSSFYVSSCSTAMAIIIKSKFSTPTGDRT